MAQRFLTLILLAGWCMTIDAQAEQKKFTVTVEAGAHDRRDTPVYFSLPAESGKGPWRLRDEAGKPLQVQVTPEGQGAFIVQEIKNGESKSYTLLESTLPDATLGCEVCIERDDHLIKVTVDGTDVLHYAAEPGPLPKGYGEEFLRGSYISEIFTPSGKPVTDDAPPNHKHHHALWWSWTKTQFEGRNPDFWNLGGKTGTVVMPNSLPRKVEIQVKEGTKQTQIIAPQTMNSIRKWNGPVYGGFKAAMCYVDLSAKPEPKIALRETWDVTVYRVGKAGKKYALFDLLSTQKCASQSPLSLPKYHYGGLGFRGNRQWEGADKTFFLSSEGKERNNGNETRAKWCHIGGKVDGELAGIAILDHPSNFRHPQPMRMHPSEPFFCYAPSQLGDWQITPEKPYVSRYRFIVADGAPDKAEIERFWNDFATPPRVTVTAAAL